MSLRTQIERDPRAWLPPLFFLGGLALVPWTLYLIVTLPTRHVQTSFYDLAWGGFDAALAALLVVTGYGILKRKRWAPSAATAAGTMLLCDAWFDVLTAGGDGERIVAIALAAAVEVPAAILCLLIARRLRAEAD